MSKPDIWKKYRTSQDHFTPEEIAFIKRCFKEGWKTTNVARELGCSRRVIQLRYSQLRQQTSQQTSEARPMITGPRHYTSNFEPS